MTSQSGRTPRPSPLLQLLVVVGAFGLAPPACDSTTGPIDPERHRPALRKLEVILYRPTLPEPEDRKAIEDAAAALAKDIGDRPGKAREAARALEAWSAKIGGEGEERFQTVSLVEARAEWEELRARLFASAIWLGESTPFLEEAQGGATRKSAASPETGQEATPNSSFVLEEMTRIVDRAEVFLEGLGTCSGADDYASAAERWDDWKRAHDNDVVRAKQSVDTRYERALGGALRALSGLSEPLKGGPCDPHLNNDAQMRVRNARAKLIQARDSVARINAGG